MIHQLVQRQQAYFLTGDTKPYEFRVRMLQRLQGAVRANEAGVLAALHQDLNKPDMEGYMTEYGLVLEEIAYAMKHLRAWMKPKHVKTPLTSFPGKSVILSEPYGVTLIMAPWNYPFMLTLEPLVGAIAAGNCAIVKPSAYSPATSAVIKKIIGEAFDPRYAAVIEGGRSENQALLRERFDYIFFTGSIAVGKLVMEAAAKHLTPVSLELGGKSPCIVDKTADIRLAARRIAFGKYLNGGQTCVAPDYLLAQEEIKDELIACIKQEVAAFFPKEDYSSMAAIVNERHYHRLMGLMEHEAVAFGGQGNPATRIIAPTVLDHVAWDAPVMQEEIFGPILPVLSYTNPEEIITEIRSRPKPLALYLFTKDREMEARILSEVSFGGGCVNDTIMHVASPHMGFGGVGYSGMGSYHGRASYDTFSHKKSVLKRGNMDPGVRYRPYTDWKYKLLRRLMK